MLQEVSQVPQEVFQVHLVASLDKEEVSQVLSLVGLRHHNSHNSHSGLLQCPPTHLSRLSLSRPHSLSSLYSLSPPVHLLHLLLLKQPPRPQ